MKIGIFGEPLSGKSRVVNLWAAQSGTKVGESPQKKALYVVNIPDERLDTLEQIFHPRKKVYSTITLAEIKAGSEGFVTSQNSPDLKTCDLILFLVPSFLSDEPGLLPGGRPIHNYVADMVGEFCLEDYLIGQKRLERIAKEGKKGRDKKFLEKIITFLEESKPLIDVELSVEEKRMSSGFSFLSEIPIIVVVNSGENQIGNSDIDQEVDRIGKRGLSALVSCLLLEEEVMDLEPGEREAFLLEMGIRNLLIPSLLETSRKLLGKISFFTIGSDEVRAWDIERGSTAKEAAGRVHSDMERGFIRAEVINYEDFMKYKDLNAAKDAGQLRVEGKDYQVEDGDIINVRFNV